MTHVTLRRGVFKNNSYLSNRLNYPNTEFHENLSSGNRVVPCGRTDGQRDRYNEANLVAFSQICERAQKLRN